MYEGQPATYIDYFIDIEVEFDGLFAWVARVLPQYTIPELHKTPIRKFYRLVWEAERKHKDDMKKLRGK